MADHDGALNSVLKTSQYSHRGQYEFELVDTEVEHGDSFGATASGHGFMTVTVDDWIPCDSNGQPKFARPNGAELWVMLLEKAIAKSKYFGSYAALDGGHVAYALFLLTGEPCYRWKWYDSVDVLERSVGASGSKSNKVGFRDTNNKCSREEFFEKLKAWVSEGKLLGAGSSGEDKQSKGDKAGSGIVPGHAYAIKDVIEEAGIKLLKLRNPWGTYINEDGHWGKNSALWEQNPALKDSYWKKAYADGDSGTFWMDYEGFLNTFMLVDVCMKKQTIFQAGMENVEDGSCGLCKECVCKCLSYWFCCKVCRLLYCNRICPMDDRRAVTDESERSNV